MYIVIIINPLGLADIYWILPVLFRSFNFLAPEDNTIKWLWNDLALSVPDIYVCIAQ